MFSEAGIEDKSGHQHAPRDRHSGLVENAAHGLLVGRVHGMRANSDVLLSFKEVQNAEGNRLVPLYETFSARTRCQNDVPRPILQRRSVFSPHVGRRTRYLIHPKRNVQAETADSAHQQIRARSVKQALCRKSESCPWRHLV